jgi:ubiquitin thioesterase OTU1
MIHLKLTWSSANAKVSINKDEAFGALLSIISEKTSIPKEKIQISTGFPPTLLIGKKSDRLDERSIVSGTAIIVREGIPPSLVDDKPDGEPPSEGPSFSYMTALEHLGFPQEFAKQAIEVASLELMLAAEVCEQLLDIESNNFKVFRRVIDADNSCLFNSLGYAMLKDRTGMSGTYRSMVAESVRARPEMYTEEFLGMPPDEYARWICNPEKWGGEIEMNILSERLEVEIAAVDIQTGLFLVYGSEKGYDKRVYVVYDGVHYDAIAFGVENDATGACVTIFSPQDQGIMEGVKKIATELRSKKQFVNLSGCDLQCLVCRVGLRGQKDAQLHASQTGHQNFGQVNV